MTPNPLYQALVRELEAHVPPRVASVVLREGLGEAGASSETLDLPAAIKVLQGAVFRQLQVRLRSADAARALIVTMEASLRASQPAKPAPAPDRAVPYPAEGGDEGPEGTDARPPSPVSADVAAKLTELKGALKPLNLYFSWAEVRKLRSLVQLAENEAGAGGDPHGPFAEAEAQLAIVHQKLEDQLVLQARTLADLEGALEAVAPLGTPAVRRLDALIATVRAAHQRRTLVEAEVERAEKLARELRKLVESTVVDGVLPDLGRGDGRRRAPAHVARPAVDPAARAGPAPVGGAPGGASGEGDTNEGAARDGDANDDADRDVALIDPAQLPPDTRDRLLALDVEGEVRDLEALASRHAELLRHVPALHRELEAVRAEHAAGRAVGARLGQLAEGWRAQVDARRQALSDEFQAMQREFEGLVEAVDVTDLRRAWTVATDVLRDALPSFEDVATVRELHAVAVTRAEELASRERERTTRLHDQHFELEVVRSRLESAWRDSASSVRLQSARVRLRGVLDAASTEAAPDAATLDSLSDAESAWERAVAEASDDHVERWRAQVRELAVRLARLPDIASLRARSLAIRQQVVDAETRSDLGEDQVNALQHLAEQLIAESRTAVASRLDQIAHEAGEPAPEALLRALQAAARQLDQGGFPNLEAVELAVRATRDERRAGTLRRYLRGRQSARQLADAGVPAASDLPDLVAAARSMIESDEGGEEAVARLEAGLAEAQHQVADRLAGFDARLDGALAGLAAVARLNSDDVVAVRRVLEHLDGERAAIGRVSPGLQARLFEALAEAESKLDGLRAAYETTRAIADQLMAGDLDPFAALFGDAPETATAARGVAERAPDGLATWLEGYLALDEVDGAVVLAPAGRWWAGRTPDGTDLASVADAIDGTIGAWAALGACWGDGPPELALLDLGGRPTWVAPLEEQGCAVLWCRQRTTGGQLGDRLRDDRIAVVAMLRAEGAAAP